MSSFRYIFSFITVLLFSYSAFAQDDKRPMTVEDLVQWQRITGRLISDDGKWIAVKTSPWQGDSEVTLYGSQGGEVTTIPCGNRMAFSSSSSHLLVSVSPPKEQTDSLKLKKTKREDMPMEKVNIISLSGGQEEIDSIKSYKMAANADWFAYQRGAKKDSTLYVRSIDGRVTREFNYVTGYGFAEKGDALYYLSQPKADSLPAGLFVYYPSENREYPVLDGRGDYKQLAFDKKGDNLAFLFKVEKDSVKHNYILYKAGRGEAARKLADMNNPAIPEGWIISTDAALRFSENADRLYLGIAPQPRERDTTVLAEYRPNVHVWTWDEPVQYTQQDHDRKEESKRSYRAVIHLANDKFVRLASPEIPSVVNTPHLDAPVVLGLNNNPYKLESTWLGREKTDLYLIDAQTGESELLKQGLLARPYLSPEGKFAYWYSLPDSCWFSYSLEDKREYRLTDPSWFTAWNRDYDVPDTPPSLGIAGWTVGDESILIYDTYDIWQFDPRGRIEPVNLTVNGRERDVVYRAERLDKDEISIDPKQSLILSSFNRKSKSYGYYSLKIGTKKGPEKLIDEDLMVDRIVKAKKADRVMFSKQSYTQFPDVWSADIKFKKQVMITDLSRQQNPFIWGTAELVSWISLDGKKLEGVVYKPENFDPSKKYPLLVNFYERNSENYNVFKIPEPHRSTIDYRMYNSNGYVIFNPDVVYEEGYPGESCYNCVMPGISMLINEGYIDEKAIGAQGHSWGGYQVAYLATRTNLFAAIESGAPVVNMTSAYGGIRWGSGKNRSFQYEHGQSRIGGSIWQYPLRYLENSPLFTMDKVETPILIMHNDQDGHVPWYQGIEYFVALRRLQKPAWLLNYTGEIHWPDRVANRADFQHRMFQFFEHYLKGEPMPKWMSDGVPAVDRDFELGY